MGGNFWTASPSSRRAWIEIKLFVNMWPLYGVALLAEGVDRNFKAQLLLTEPHESPSSRRAWIEIRQEFFCIDLSVVALLAEGVDRNHP